MHTFLDPDRRGRALDFLLGTLTSLRTGDVGGGERKRGRVRKDGEGKGRGRGKWDGKK